MNAEGAPGPRERGADRQGRRGPSGPATTHQNSYSQTYYSQTRICTTPPSVRRYNSICAAQACRRGNLRVREAPVQRGSCAGADCPADRPRMLPCTVSGAGLRPGPGAMGGPGLSGSSVRRWPRAAHQPRARHSPRCGRSVPRVVSLPCPGYTHVGSGSRSKRRSVTSLSSSVKSSGPFAGGRPEAYPEP